MTGIEVRTLAAIGILQIFMCLPCNSKCVLIFAAVVNISEQSRSAAPHHGFPRTHCRSAARSAQEPGEFVQHQRAIHRLLLSVRCRGTASISSQLYREHKEPFNFLLFQGLRNGIS